MLRAAVILSLVLATSITHAQSARPYDGIQAGLDAYRLAEEQRRIVAEGQVRLSTDLKYWPPQWTMPGPPPFAFAPYPLFRASDFAAPIRQPIAQYQFQSGPNRWESHPIYDPPPSPLFPLPPVTDSLLDRTPYATSAIPRLDPAPALPLPPRRGPREY
jgi:hypothetical protein